VATCNDCHVPHTFPEKYIVKAENGWNHSSKFTLQNFKQPIRIRPSNLRALQHNCVECHAAMVQAIAGHEDVERGQARCTDCHRSVGHMALD
jgi:cytochrome c nitrite reductase small subunit